MRIFSYALICFVIAAAPASACPFGTTKVFLKDPPRHAEKKSTAAKVEILSSGYRYGIVSSEGFPYFWVGRQGLTVKVKVREAISGVEPGQTLSFKTQFTSCNEAEEAPAEGAQYFIAGTLRGDQFDGANTGGMSD